MINKIIKAFILICLILPSMALFVGCLNNDSKDLQQKLENAQVLVLDGVEYKSNTVQAEVNKTYYFKVTNNCKFGNKEYKLDYITACDVDNDYEKLTGEKGFGIEGSNAFWTVKVYNENKQKLDFIGSLDNYLYDPMAEKFELNFGNTCYFAVTFRENTNFIFKFGSSEYLSQQGII